MATPLGDVRVDFHALHTTVDVADDPRAHAREHCLEVQLPFLQRALSDFTVVPLLVSDAGPAEVGAALEALWGGSETLVVISSDLSHYLPYSTARTVDAETAERILALDTRDIEPDRACGCAAINGLLWVARRKHLHSSLLDLRNSGDTAGGHDQVVGYGAFSFSEPFPDPPGAPG